MASTFYITHRRMEDSPSGTHEHVGRVKLSGGTELTRDDVFKWMRDGDTFYTRAQNGDEARVIRVKCGACMEDYLRTDADTSEADNLDELPKF